MACSLIFSLYCVHQLLKAHDTEGTKYEAETQGLGVEIFFQKRILGPALPLLVDKQSHPITATPPPFTKNHGYTIPFPRSLEDHRRR